MHEQPARTAPPQGRIVRRGETFRVATGAQKQRKRLTLPGKQALAAAYFTLRQPSVTVLV